MEKLISQFMLVMFRRRKNENIYLKTTSEYLEIQENMMISLAPSNNKLSKR